jgi:hypothetical protein
LLNYPDRRIYGEDCSRSSGRSVRSRCQAFGAVGVAYRRLTGRGNDVSPEDLAQVSRDLYGLDIKLRVK